MAHYVHDGANSAAGAPTKTYATAVRDNCISEPAAGTEQWFVLVPSRDGVIVFDTARSLPASETDPLPEITIQAQLVDGNTTTGTGMLEQDVLKGDEIYIRLTCSTPARLCLHTSTYGYNGPWQRGQDETYVLGNSTTGAHRESDPLEQIRYLYGGPREDLFYVDISGPAYVLAIKSQLAAGQVGSWLLDQPYGSVYQEYGEVGGRCAWSHARVGDLGSQPDWDEVCAPLTEAIRQNIPNSIGWHWSQRQFSVFFDNYKWLVEARAASLQLSIDRLTREIGPFAGRANPIGPSGTTLQWEDDRCELLDLQVAPTENSDAYYQTFPDHPRHDPDQRTRWYYKAHDGYAEPGEYGPTSRDGVIGLNSGIAQGPETYTSTMAIAASDYAGGVAPFATIPGSVLAEAKAAEEGDAEVAYRGGLTFYGTSPEMLDADPPFKMFARFDTTAGDGLQELNSYRYGSYLDCSVTVRPSRHRFVATPQFTSPSLVDDDLPTIEITPWSASGTTGDTRVAWT